MSFIIDDRFAQLPKNDLTLPQGQLILNIQQKQYAFIQGAPGKTFNRVTKKKFFVPGHKDVSSIFDKPGNIENPIQWKAAEYQSKVSKNAIEALHAVESEKAKQAYFDKLDANNLFPRKGRSIALPRSVASQTNADGSATIFHQPGWIRMQQNQFIGDTTKSVERVGDGLPDVANPRPGKTILGSNKVMNKTNNAETMTEETGRIGNVSSISMGTDVPSFSIPKHRVRDLRTVASNTELPDVDKTTLDLIFANGGKFQTFIDQLKFGNETLQTQLRSQNVDLGRMASTTMQTFKDILKSVGFDEKSIPSTVSPDDIHRILRQVETISPVALSEIGAMRTTIEALKAQKSAELKDFSQQYNFQEQPASASKKRPSVAPVIDTSAFKPHAWESSVSPSDIFSNSPVNSNSSRSTYASGSPVRAQSVQPDVPVEPQFTPERSPTISVPTSPYSSMYPDANDIFGRTTAQMVLCRETRPRFLE
ncbi:hypothetical protein HDU89_001358, partial [Geranomyces variabilis]